jgi:hypothetical protein
MVTDRHFFSAEKVLYLLIAACGIGCLFQVRRRKALDFDAVTD